MPELHNPLDRASLETRLRTLSPKAQPKWGRMTVDQMLWHLNQGLAINLGHFTVPMKKLPIPRALMRVVALYLPWPKGVPTAPEMQAKARHDFEAERQKCLALIAETAQKPQDSTWGTHPAFGQMNGAQFSRLAALHLDHHLRQFGA